MPSAEFLSDKFTFSGGFKLINGNHQKLSSSDFDADGRDDILRIETYVRELATCGSSETRMKNFTVLYSLGNGQFNMETFSLPTNNNEGYEISSPNFIQIADFDGDKQPEVLLTVNDVNDSYRSKTFMWNKRVNTVVLLTQANTVTALSTAKSVQIGDYDGGGDAELYVLRKDDGFLDIVDVSSTSISMTLASRISYPYDYFNLGDFNGDGISDLLYLPAGIKIW